VSFELIFFVLLVTFAAGIMAGVWASGRVDAMQDEIDESRVLPEDFQK
jgi:lipopolysaccharide biosynthesis regulator YciM